MRLELIFFELLTDLFVSLGKHNLQSYIKMSVLI